MIVFVQMQVPQGGSKNAQVEVEADTTVAVFRDLVGERFDVGPNSFRILWKGLQLADASKTLAECEVGKEDTLRIVLLPEASRLYWKD